MNGAGAYKIIELVVLFGAAAGFCLWQLRSLARLRREREQAEPEERQSGESEAVLDEPARHLERQQELHRR